MYELSTDALQNVKNWHDTNRQSHSDFVLVINGKKIRIQAKNFLSIQEAIIHGEERLMQLNALGKEINLDGFITNYVNNGNTAMTTVPPEVLEYVMANEIWFQTAGSWIRGVDVTKSTKSERVQKRKFGSRILDTFLSNSMTAYIGVQLEKTAEDAEEPFSVVADLSNLFYLVNNLRIVPTYEIVREIKNGFAAYGNSITKLRVKVKNTEVGLTSNAEEYYNRKREEGNKENRGGLRAGGGYVDKWLVDIGVAQGENILGNAILSTSNLDLELLKYVQSSYNF